MNEQFNSQDIQPNQKYSNKEQLDIFLYKTIEMVQQYLVKERNLQANNLLRNTTKIRKIEKQIELVKKTLEQLGKIKIIEVTKMKINKIGKNNLYEKQLGSNFKTGLIQRRKGVRELFNIVHNSVSSILTGYTNYDEIDIEDKEITVNIEQECKLIHIMLNSQLESIIAFNSLLLNPKFTNNNNNNNNLQKSIIDISSLFPLLILKPPTLLYSLLQLISAKLQPQHLQYIISLITDKVYEQHYKFKDYNYLLDFYILKIKQKEQKYKKEEIQRIYRFDGCELQMLLKYGSEEYSLLPQLQIYLTKQLKQVKSNSILFYMPQIYQCLQLESGIVIRKFLIQYGLLSALFCHQLLWKSRVESKIEEKMELTEGLQKLEKNSVLIKMKVEQEMNRQQVEYWQNVDRFYEDVTSVSGKCLPKMTKQEKVNVINNHINTILVNKDVYLPTNPQYQVISIEKDSGRPMQSAARVPVMITFNCRKFEGPDLYLNSQYNLYGNYLNDKDKDQDKVKDCDLSCEYVETKEAQPNLVLQNSCSSAISKSPNKLIQIRKDSQTALDQIHVIIDGDNDILKTDESNDLTIISNQALTLRKTSEKLKNSNKKRKETDQQYQQQQQQIEKVQCIFKVFDDIRQDNLCIQIIQMFEHIFKKGNLDVSVFPYKTISNRTGTENNIGGIIEVIKDSQSRDEIGKIYGIKLDEFFLHKFGEVHSQKHQIARDNFIRSQAGYTIVSYILQVKDRHNGNILIDKNGNIIHIDFGFIFDISPGNNLRFEDADFKFTKEMANIMGGYNSQHYLFYSNLCIKAFLLIRQFKTHIINIIQMMYQSGLKCFLPHSNQNLHNRFMEDKNDLEASIEIQKMIDRAYDRYTTNFYDDIQYMQNKIEH